jgi:hypothetical protein
MNERIIEMAKQCGYWSGQTIEMNDVGIAKFAELIVRECALLCESRPGPGDDVRSRQHCSEQILEHFGVE